MGGQHRAWSQWVRDHPPLATASLLLLRVLVGLLVRLLCCHCLLLRVLVLVLLVCCRLLLMGAAGLRAVRLRVHLADAVRQRCRPRRGRVRLRQALRQTLLQLRRALLRLSLVVLC